MEAFHSYKLAFLDEEFEEIEALATEEIIGLYGREGMIVDKEAFIRAFSIFDASLNIKEAARKYDKMRADIILNVVLAHKWLHGIIGIVATAAEKKFEEMGGENPLHMACYFFLDKAKKQEDEKMFSIAAKKLNALVTGGREEERNARHLEKETRKALRHDPMYN